MDAFYSIVGFFASGGMFMYPILLVFAVGVAIAVERYVTLTQVTNKNQLVWEKEATKREPAVNVEMRMPEVPSSFT